MGKRLEWVDVAKGFGMLCVMLGHAPIPASLKLIIYTFHMPLFFFLSGYVFSPDRYTSFVKFIKRKCMTLFVPYIIFSFINYIFWISIRFIGSNAIERRDVSIFNPIIGTFYAQRGHEWMSHNGTMWFITCLFICEVIFYMAIKYSRNNIKKIGCELFICAVIGFLYSKYINLVLPWSLDIAFTGVVFLGLGYIVRVQSLQYHVYRSKGKLLICLISINIITGRLNGMIDMFNGTYGNFALFYISALSGICAIDIIAKYIEKSKIMIFIGKNSFVFLAFHQFPLFSVISKGMSKITFFDMDNQYILLLKGTIYVVIACIFLIPAADVINSYSKRIKKRLGMKDGMKSVLNVFSNLN